MDKMKLNLKTLKLMVRLFKAMFYSIVFMILVPITLFMDFLLLVVEFFELTDMLINATIAKVFNGY